jgi:hypothetical protein
VSGLIKRYHLFKIGLKWQNVEYKAQTHAILMPGAHHNHRTIAYYCYKIANTNIYHISLNKKFVNTPIKNWNLGRTMTLPGPWVASPLPIVQQVAHYHATSCWSAFDERWKLVLELEFPWLEEKIGRKLFFAIYTW